jgi:DNA-binding IclR family transcriptional regulator
MTSPARVLAILNLFGEERPVWHTDEINEAMGYTRATGYRYVKDLVEAGFLQKVSGGRYSLGARIIELDYRLRRSDPVLLAAVPVMDQLARKARLDAVLTTMFGMKVIDIYRASADASLQLGYGRGRPRPLFVGASPKVILSCTPRPLLVKIYEAYASEAHKHGLGSSWADFRAYLSNIRKQGFYWSVGELEEGVGGAAVPLLNEDGEALAALALVGTNEALRAMGEARMRTTLAHARDDIHARLANGCNLPARMLA